MVLEILSIEVTPLLPNLNLKQAAVASSPHTSDESFGFFIIVFAILTLSTGHVKLPNSHTPHSFT